MSTKLQKLQKLSEEIEKPRSKEQQFLDSISALAGAINNNVNT